MSECVISHGVEKDGTPRTARAARGLLCKNHSKRLAEWLRDIAVDYALLDTILIPASVQGERKSKGDAAPAPTNLMVVALRDSERAGAPRDWGDELWYELPDIPSVLSVLHARAEDIRCLLDPSREPVESVKDVNLTTEVEYLLNTFDTLCAVEWVDEAFEEIKRAWISLQSAHARPRPKSLGSCLEVECSGRVWPRTDTAPWCSKCKRVYSTAADLARLAVQEAKKRKPREEKPKPAVVSLAGDAGTRRRA